MAMPSADGDGTASRGYWKTLGSHWLLNHPHLHLPSTGGRARVLFFYRDAVYMRRAERRWRAGADTSCSFFVLRAQEASCEQTQSDKHNLRMVC